MVKGIVIVVIFVVVWIHFLLGSVFKFCGFYDKATIEFVAATCLGVMLLLIDKFLWKERND